MASFYNAAIGEKMRALNGVFLIARGILVELPGDQVGWRLTASPDSWRDARAEKNVDELPPDSAGFILMSDQTREQFRGGGFAGGWAVGFPGKGWGHRGVL